MPATPRLVVEGLSKTFPGQRALDNASLRVWCRSNLASYWAGWVTRGARPATRDGMVLLTDWAVEWCVLGVLRLRHTIDTGAIPSKSGAGRWALSALALDPSERALIEEALVLRGATVDGSGADGPDRGHAAERRERTVAFMRRVIDESARPA